jgi:hypothetical protein
MRFTLRSSTLVVVLALILSLAVVALAAAQATDKVTASDQAISNNTVTIPKVTATQDGWIVIHAQANGNPGPDIGHAAVKAGDNNNVVVTIDPSKATPVVYAMLHIDAGTKGTYEFPGADVPVAGAQADVNPTFKLTNVTGAQAAATPAAAATTAAQPSKLPTTGDNLSYGRMALAAVGALALAAGIRLNVGRAR